jgi:hypothetical protein
MARKIPALAEVSPKYATLVDQIARLQEEQTSLESERREILLTMPSRVESEHANRLNSVIAGTPLPALGQSPARLGARLKTCTTVRVPRASGTYRGRLSLGKPSSRQSTLFAQSVHPLVQRSPLMAEGNLSRPDLEFVGSYVGDADRCLDLMGRHACVASYLLPSGKGWASAPFTCAY